MTEIILLLFVAFLFVDTKDLVALAGKAGTVYGKLQNAKRNVLAELQSETNGLASAISPEMQSPEPVRARLERWALGEPAPINSTADQELDTRIEALCSETVVEEELSSSLASGSAHSFMATIPVTNV